MIDRTATSRGTTGKRNRPGEEVSLMILIRNNSEAATPPTLEIAASVGKLWMARIASLAAVRVKTSQPASQERK